MTEQLEQPKNDRDDAVSRLKKRRDFENHLVVYAIVNAAVWTLWLLTGHGYPWPAWISGGWAIGVVLNAWDVYVRRPITEEDIERELRRVRSAH